MSILTEAENELQLFKEGILKKILKKVAKSVVKPAKPADLVKFANKTSQDTIKGSPVMDIRTSGRRGPRHVSPDEKAMVAKHYTNWGMSANKFRSIKDELRSTPKNLRNKKLEQIIKNNLDKNLPYGGTSWKKGETWLATDHDLDLPDQWRHKQSRLPKVWKDPEPTDYW